MRAWQVLGIQNKHKAHNPPHKILRHMPIIPRIQRLFCCKQLAKFYRWCATHRSELGVIQIPIDLITMKHIDDMWIDKFKYEVQSL